MRKWWIPRIGSLVKEALGFSSEQEDLTKLVTAARAESERRLQFQTLSCSCRYRSSHTLLQTLPANETAARLWKEPLRYSSRIIFIAALQFSTIFGLIFHLWLLNPAYGQSCPAGGGSLYSLTGEEGLEEGSPHQMNWSEKLTVWGVGQWFVSHYGEMQGSPSGFLHLPNCCITLKSVKDSVKPLIQQVAIFQKFYLGFFSSSCNSIWLHFLGENICVSLELYSPHVFRKILNCPLTWHGF